MTQQSRQELEHELNNTIERIEVLFQRVQHIATDAKLAIRLGMSVADFKRDAAEELKACEIRRDELRRLLSAEAINAR